MSAFLYFLPGFTLQPAFFGPTDVYGAWNLGCGMLLILFSASMYSEPRFHRGLGQAVMTSAFLSIAEGGGLGLGFVFGMLGGYYGTKWKPPLISLNQLLQDKN
ncbi:MAG TPA: hypothetical protein VMS77_06190 [Conexivisphaerales archaeon]|nr:hypothetical protein [Conexivisphaerales archaeon]